MTDPTAEPSQRAEYREDIAGAIRVASGLGGETWRIVSDAASEYALADAALSIRDTEMVTLRERCAYWEKRFQQQCERIDDTAMSIISLSSENERLRAELAGLRERAVEVQKYWRDWPCERRDKVRVLSQFLGGAIDDLATLVESWRPAPESTPAPVSLERDPDASTSVAAPEPATPPKPRPCDDFVGDGMRCDQPKGHDGRHSNRNW